MSVRYEFTIEMYGLRIVYVSCSTCLLFFTLALVTEDSLEDRRRRKAREQMQTYIRRLSAQQIKDGSTKVKGEDLRANTNALA